eukprot:CAMPEP_0197654786 /NCGR_PEP_ID=MMETSP1338-20131121/39056_1 /TAXON_ID=43686 ORGANISM="Pelagodinium beii, Strain RCC1491" /NCGR_SAMPLE_ID=MMETSP1338 /ASSEMBLY_ACC=CAM_ASM_000754 /LENGTH=106 /DNA_ID=CAMNT_0043230291 /DNA_START=71 /DNA_END=388 /DNA_ORIENTATION=+
MGSLEEHAKAAPDIKLRDLQLRIAGLGGCLGVVTATRAMTGKDVKQQVEAAFGVPSSEQHLLCGSVTLEDATSMGALAEEVSDVSEVTLVRTPEVTRVHSWDKDAW